VPLRASPLRYSRLSAHPADIKTHPRASPPLPERKLREAHSRSMLMLLRNVARCDRLAARARLNDEDAAQHQSSG